MATLQLTHEFKKYLGDGTIDLDTHAYRAFLSNVAPDLAANAVKADITEITAGNGYVATGVALTSVQWVETGAGTGIWRFTCADFSWTASGGSIAAFRYVWIFDDTPTSPADPLVGVIDYGSAITITDGNTFLADVGAGGLFTLA